MTKQKEYQIIKKYKDKSREDLIQLYSKFRFKKPANKKFSEEIKIALKYRGVKYD